MLHVAVQTPMENMVVGKKLAATKNVTAIGPRCVGDVIATVYTVQVSITGSNNNT